MNKWNKLYIGLVLGIVGPLVISGIELYYSAKKVVATIPGYTMEDYYKVAFTTKGFLPNIMLAAVVNLVAFYLFLRKEYWYSVRGVILATLLIAISVYSVYFLL